MRNRLRLSSVLMIVIGLLVVGSGNFVGATAPTLSASPAVKAAGQRPTIPYTLATKDGVISDILGKRFVHKGDPIYTGPTPGTVRPFTGCNGTIVYYNEYPSIAWYSVNRRVQSCSQSSLIGTYTQGQTVHVVQGVADGELVCNAFPGQGTHVWYNTDDGSWITAAATSDPRWDTSCS